METVATGFRLRYIPSMIFIALSLFSPHAQGYEVGTHRAISEKAAQTERLKDVLRNDLGFEKSLDQTLRDYSVIRWIMEGSAREDHFLRYLFHFHDPLRRWDDSGLGLGVRAQSSVRWAQNDIQDWSWPKAREYFHRALTSSTQIEREQAFADTFRALGQLLHLAQDAGSPAHTRNDPHVAYTYEDYVRDLQREQEAIFVDLLATPQAPHPDWQTLTLNPLAPAPIARLFDTDQYDGTNPDVTASPRIGLAEYTNANFFSEDRTFPEDTNPLFRFPYPARSSAIEVDHPITLGNREQVIRRYYKKQADGDTGYLLGTVGFLRDYLQRYGLDPNRFMQKPALDESVYRDYAVKLLPRAVGYSAALLDYFFRGKLEFDVRPNRENPAQLDLTFYNTSEVLETPPPGHPPLGLVNQVIRQEFEHFGFRVRDGQLDLPDQHQK